MSAHREPGDNGGAEEGVSKRKLEEFSENLEDTIKATATNLAVLKLKKQRLDQLTDEQHAHEVETARSVASPGSPTISVSAANKEQTKLVAEATAAATRSACEAIMAALTTASTPPPGTTTRSGAGTPLTSPGTQYRSAMAAAAAVAANMSDQFVTPPPSPTSSTTPAGAPMGTRSTTTVALFPRNNKPIPPAVQRPAIIRVATKFPHGFRKGRTEMIRSELRVIFEDDLKPLGKKEQESFLKGKAKTFRKNLNQYQKENILPHGLGRPSSLNVAAFEITDTLARAAKVKKGKTTEDSDNNSSLAALLQAESEKQQLLRAPDAQPTIIQPYSRSMRRKKKQLIDMHNLHVTPGQLTTEARVNSETSVRNAAGYSGLLGYLESLNIQADLLWNYDCSTFVYGLSPSGQVLVIVPKRLSQFNSHVLHDKDKKGKGRNIVRLKYPAIISATGSSGQTVLILRLTEKDVRIRYSDQNKPRQDLIFPIELNCLQTTGHGTGYLLVVWAGVSGQSISTYIDLYFNVPTILRAQAGEQGKNIFGTHAVPKPPTPPKFKMKPAEAKKVRSKVTTAIRGCSEIGPMISDASRTKVFVDSFGKAGVKVKLGNEWERNLDQIKQNTPALLNMNKDEMNKYMSNDASYIEKMRQNGRHQSADFQNWGMSDDTISDQSKSKQPWRQGVIIMNHTTYLEDQALEESREKAEKAEKAKKDAVTAAERAKQGKLTAARKEFIEEWRRQKAKHRECLESLKAAKDANVAAAKMRKERNPDACCDCLLEQFGSIDDPNAGFYCDSKPKTQCACNSFVHECCLSRHGVAPAEFNAVLESQEPFLCKPCKNVQELTRLAKEADPGKQVDFIDAKMLALKDEEEKQEAELEADDLEGLQASPPVAVLDEVEDDLTFAQLVDKILGEYSADELAEEEGENEGENDYNFFGDMDDDDTDSDSGDGDDGDCLEEAEGEASANLAESFYRIGSDATDKNREDWWSWFDVVSKGIDMKLSCLLFDGEIPYLKHHASPFMQRVTRRMKLITAKLAANCTAVQQMLDVGNFFLTIKNYLRYHSFSVLQMAQKAVDDLWDQVKGFWS